MRSVLVRAAEALLVSFGGANVAERFHRRKAIILAYHNVVPPGMAPVGDSGLHLPWARFIEQIQLLEATHEIVALESIVDTRSTNVERPRVALTFDDAYRGALSHAIPFLMSRGHPATIFVAPGCLAGEGFWWDRLARSDGTGLPNNLRNHALNELRGLGKDIETWARDRGVRLQDLPGYALPAGEDELATVSEASGIRLAAHSWSHANLLRLDDQELASELRSTATWLQQRFEHVDPWLAYPYGLADDRIGEMAWRVGYRAGFEVDGGWVGEEGPTDRLRVPRLNVPAGVSRNGFRLRTSGLLCW